jgi:hypothetical protein
MLLIPAQSATASRESLKGKSLNFYIWWPPLTLVAALRPVTGNSPNACAKQEKESTTMMGHKEVRKLSPSTLWEMVHVSRPLHMLSIFGVRVTISSFLLDDSSNLLISHRTN